MTDSAAIWVKLLGNIAFNPISELIGETLVQMARHEHRIRFPTVLILEVAR